MEGTMLNSIAALAIVSAASAPAVQVKPIATMQGQRASIFVPAPTGSQFAAGMENLTVKVIDAANRKTIAEFKEHKQQAMAVAWSKDGKWVASGDEGARIYVWDAKTGKRKVAMDVRHERGIQYLSFNDQGTRLISTGKEDTIRMWDTTTGKQTGVILGKGVNFYSAQWIPGTTNIIVATLGKGAQIYKSDGTLVASFGGHYDRGGYDVDFNRVTNRAVTAGADNRGNVWDVAKRTRLAILGGHTDWLIWSKFSPNGKVIATSSVDGTVKLWDAAKFAEIGTIADQSYVGSPLAFTADGKYLVTCSMYDSIQINQVTPPQPAPAVKAVKRKKK